MHAPASSDKQQIRPRSHVAELHLEGDLHMPAADQDQIAIALKQRTYSGEPDGVTSEVLEQVRRAWEDHGYFKVEVNGDAKVLTSSPASQRISINVQVDEGQQYRLREHSIQQQSRNNQRGRIAQPDSPKDGDIFDRTAISKGLDNLRSAYLQMGHLNFTSIPNTQMDEGTANDFASHRC